MKDRTLWAAVLLLIAGLQLAACARPEAQATDSNEPAHVERLAETNLNRVVLVPEAAKRLAIKTAPVRMEQVMRKRIVGGEVVAIPSSSAIVMAPAAGTISAPDSASIPVPGMHLSNKQPVLRLLALEAQQANSSVMELGAPHDSVLLQLHVTPGQVVAEGQALFEVADLSQVWVRVPLYVGDLNRVARDKPAQILPLALDDQTPGVSARPVDISAIGDSAEATAALYYEVNRAEHNLVPGQRVRVELSLLGSGAERKVIPYSAVIYDVHGDTWAYVSPEPLTFVRQRITVEYIAGDLAILSQGPDPGTPVVAVGAAELFGTEFGIGH